MIVRIIFKINLTMATALVVLLAAAPARADRRAYAVTYEAVTAPKGELDVELWTTYARDGEFLDGPPSKGFRHMVELEYGLTDRWDVALYNMLDTTSDSANTGYAGLKVETRYRLLQPGSWIVDPIIYFEYQWLRHGDADAKYEAKLILARDFGPWNVAFNIAGEAEHLRDGTWVPELEYALGVSREIGGPAFKVGYEIFGKTEREGGEIEPFVWTGPALSWATRFQGPMQGFWLTVGAGRGITDESETWYGRAIAGLQF
jgi:hypothetical protein